MLCFRVIFWGVVLVILMLPGAFLVGIIGRIAGFRPGSKVGTGETVFGWVGIIVLTVIMLAICVIAGLIDWGVATVAEQGPIFDQNLVPNPRPIPGDWREANMQKIFLSDMQEFNVRVGHGNFGKNGKLGYFSPIGDSVRVDNKFYPHSISMHPPAFSQSTVRYRLDRNTKLFKAWAALNDTEPGAVPQSAPTFVAFGDRVCLWVSRPVNRTGIMEECRINVEGVDTLELQIRCPASHTHVRGVWLEPAIYK